MAEKQAPDPVDVHVGRIIRARRLMAGASQQALAETCGVTFQQIQKYERGANRVSCSMLARIARFLNAPVEDFFPEPGDADGVLAGLGAAQELAYTPGGFELAKAYLTLDTQRRASLRSVAETLVGTMAENPGRSYVTGGDDERGGRRHALA